jgi:hypothetical protein
MLLISELIFSVTLTLAVEVDCCWILVDVTLSRLVWGVSGILVAGCSEFDSCWGLVQLYTPWDDSVHLSRDGTVPVQTADHSLQDYLHV